MAAWDGGAVRPERGRHLHGVAGLTAATHAVDVDTADHVLGVDPGRAHRRADDQLAPWTNGGCAAARRAAGRSRRAVLRRVQLHPVICASTPKQGRSIRGKSMKRLPEIMTRAK